MSRWMWTALPVHLPRSRCRWMVGLMLAILCSYAAAAPFSVTVILSDQSETYKTVFTSLQNKLSGSNIKLVSADGPGQVQGTSLIVTVGVHAANALPPATAAPVLYTLLPKSRYDALAEMRQRSGADNKQSALYLNQPVERQLDLLADVLPHHKRVGILSSVSTRNEVEQIGRIASGYNLTLYVADVNERVSLSDALQDVLANSDVLLALPDTSIYNGSTIRNILISSYRNDKPLIGFSAGFVKAGAIAAVFSTPEQYGEQIAAMIVHYSNTGGLPPPQYPQLFEVSLNKVVADSLGMTLRGARTIEQEIAKQEHARP